MNIRHLIFQIQSLISEMEWYWVVTAIVIGVVVTIGIGYVFSPAYLPFAEVVKESVPYALIVTAAIGLAAFGLTQ